MNITQTLSSCSECGAEISQDAGLTCKGCIAALCVDGDAGGCNGPVWEYTTLSGSGARFPRCELHYESYAARMNKLNADLQQRYPTRPPAGWSPADAGEAWDTEDYYTRIHRWGEGCGRGVKRECPCD